MDQRHGTHVEDERGACDEAAFFCLRPFAMDDRTSCVLDGRGSGSETEMSVFKQVRALRTLKPN